MRLGQLFIAGSLFLALGARAPALHAQEKAVKGKAAAAGRSKPATGAAEKEKPKEKPKEPGGDGPTQTNDLKVEEAEGPEGVKTYSFRAIEVEGRLKSPQLIYFLRRVRAEFRAGALGHRSFLGELSDTRRETAFR